MKKKKQLYMVTMIAGTILAMLMTFSHFVDTSLADHQIEQANQVNNEASQDEPEQETGTVISLPSFSLPSSVHLKPGLDFHFLFEILFQPQANAEFVESDVKTPTNFFSTLFRVIIAPNAP